MIYIKKEGHLSPSYISRHIHIPLGDRSTH